MDNNRNELNLVLALFNGNLYNEAKTNINLFKSYLSRLGYGKDSQHQQILDLIPKYNHDQISEHLFLNSFPELKMNEKEFLWNKYLEMESLTQIDLGLYRDTFKSACEAEIIHRSNECSTNNEKLAMIKSLEYKSSFSTKIINMTLDDADSNDEDPLNPSGVKSAFNFINDSYPTECYPNGQLVCVSARPGSGKSLFLFMEALQAIDAGKRVHYLALGDLKKSDFLIRLAAQFNYTDVRLIYGDYHKFVEPLKDHCRGKFDFACIKPQSLSPREYTDYMMSRVDDYDVFFVDYDANFKNSKDNLYEMGEESYNCLAELAFMNKLVFVASQPKIGYYSSEKLPLEALAESSKKQQILDTVITIGKHPDSGYHCGKISIVKNRRGKNGAYSPYMMTSCLRPIEIPLDKYISLLSNPSNPTTDQLNIRLLQERFIGKTVVNGKIVPDPSYVAKPKEEEIVMKLNDDEESEVKEKVELVETVENGEDSPF